MNVVSINRRAFFDYTIEEILEAGIVLKGDEVKSVRAKQVSMVDAFATVKDGAIYLLNCHIAGYSHAYLKQEAATRESRKLLLHKKQILKLIGAVSRKGYTLIPLRMYISARGFIKVEIGLAKSKKAPDKKNAIKERDIKRETQRENKIKLR
jgi:SsrA-binding protein